MVKKRNVFIKSAARRRSGNFTRPVRIPPGTFTEFVCGVSGDFKTGSLFSEYSVQKASFHLSSVEKELDDTRKKKAKKSPIAIIKNESLLFTASFSFHKVHFNIAPSLLFVNM